MGPGRNYYYENKGIPFWCAFAFLAPESTEFYKCCPLSHTHRWDILGELGDFHVLLMGPTYGNNSKKRLTQKHVITYNLDNTK